MSDGIGWTGELAAWGVVIGFVALFVWLIGRASRRTPVSRGDNSTPTPTGRTQAGQWNDGS